MLQNYPPRRNIRSFRARGRFERPNRPKAAAVNFTTVRLSSDISANILDFAHSAKAETGLRDRRGRGSGVKPRRMSEIGTTGPKRPAGVKHCPGPTTASKGGKQENEFEI